MGFAEFLHYGGGYDCSVDFGDKAVAFAYIGHCLYVVEFVEIVIIGFIGFEEAV